MEPQYTVTAWETSQTTVDGVAMTVEVERVTFGNEATCVAWADDMGYLNHDSYSVSVEDPNGTVTYL